jgi:hypothetical protein
MGVLIEEGDCNPSKERKTGSAMASAVAISLLATAKAVALRVKAIPDFPP